VTSVALTAHAVALVIDPRVVESASGLDVVLGQVQKHGNNPLFGEDYFAEPSRPWETRFDNVYPSVVRDPDSGRLHVWYFSFLTDSDMAAVPLADRATRTYGSPDREDGLLYAESDDGLVWSKPDLGLIEFQGSTANNIVMSTQSHGIHAGGVLLDEHETDSARRYKAVFRSRRSRTMAVSFSADGRDWSEPVLWPEHSAVGDTHTNGFWDPTLQRYVVVTRGWTGSTPQDMYLGERVVMRTESPDFLTWTEPREVLRGVGEHDQIYSMPIARYGDLYVGLPAVFHKGDPQADDWDLVDTELAISTDTETWSRVIPGTPLIPRGAGTYPTGAYDCGCIYASAPIVIDDEIRIYYGGSNGTHNGFRESSLNLATLPVDRWAGYGAGSAPGYLTTTPLTVDLDTISLNVATATSGSVRAALLANDGAELAGFGLDDCEPLTGDGLRLPLRWSGEVGDIADAPVRLRLELRDAVLYAINGATKELT